MFKDMRVSYLVLLTWDFIKLVSAEVAYIVAAETCHRLLIISKLIASKLLA